MPQKQFFLITKGGPLGIFDKKNFFACFVPNLLTNRLNINKISIFKENKAKKFFLLKNTQGSLGGKEKLFLGH